jgi:hypothetical protein
MRRWLLLSLLFVGCDAAPSTGASPSALDEELQQHVGAADVVRVFDSQPENALVGVRPVLASETDQQPSYTLHDYDRGTAALSALGISVRHAKRVGDSLVVVTEQGDLERIGAAGRALVATRVLGEPALLADGSVVVAQLGNEPGESDLQWLREGTTAALAPAAGPDELPIALPDGRVAFVSGRTGLASLWVIDLETQSLQQLTNVGRTRVDAEFVPPPVRDVTVDAEAVRYDAGDGQTWRVDHRSGVAAREERH